MNTLPAFSNSPVAFRFESLEDRCLFSYGAFPVLIAQDQAIANYPTINGSGYSIVDIDSGVDSTHPNLAGKLLTGYNFVSSNTDTTDNQGHGTMTAGVMVASPWTSPSDGLQYQGVAPGAKVIPLKITDSGASSVQFDQTVGQALYWVVSEVQSHPELHIAAVNLSLRTVDQSTYASYLQKPIKLLHNLGIFIAAASGNDQNYSGVDYPANDPYVVAVGGVNPDDTVTPLTNRGPKIGLLAPGNNVPSLEPGGRYDVGGDGTSYATPYVTAAAVLVKQVDPALTPDQIETVLNQSGDSVSDPLSNMSYKRLNLNNAVALAYQQLQTPTPTPTPAPTPTPTPTPSPTSTAYPSGVPHAIAAGGTSVIQAEDFDNGGQGSGYNIVRIKANRSAPYRTARVALLPSTDAGGGYEVFNTKATEWLDYTVNVAASGNYTFGTRVSSYLTGGKYELQVDGTNVTGSISVPNTRGWAHWRTLSTTIPLTAGQHVLRLQMDAVGSQGVAGIFNYLTFAPAPQPAVARATATGATATPGVTAAEAVRTATATVPAGVFSSVASVKPWEDPATSTDVLA